MALLKFEKLINTMGCVPHNDAILAETYLLTPDKRKYCDNITRQTTDEEHDTTQEG